jgi:hypothetical protein
VARDPIAAAAGHAGRAALSPALSAHAPRGPTTAHRRARAEGVLVARPGRRRAQCLPAPPKPVVRMARFRGRGARAGTLTRTTPRRTERAPHCRSFPATRPLLQLTSTTAPRHITMVAARCQFQTSGITGWRGGGFVTKMEREHIFQVRAAQFTSVRDIRRHRREHRSITAVESPGQSVLGC